MATITTMNITSRIPNDFTQSNSQHRRQEDLIPEILQILELDDCQESRKIAEELTTKGRQILITYENNIQTEIFTRQMTDDSSELFQLLKIYWEQQWNSIHVEWFRSFLHEQKTTSTELYDQILTRTVQWGSKFLKDNTILSLVIQFLFEFNDEEVENDTLFNRVWQTLITEGRQGLKHYSNDLPKIVLAEQLENVDSPLNLALQNYFSPSLIDLLKQKDVNITRPDVIKTILDRIADCGWHRGLDDNAVRDSIAPKKLTILKQKVDRLVNEDLRRITTEESMDTSISSDPLLSPSQSIPMPTTNPENQQRQRRMQEIKMILTCIKPNEKFRPAHLIESDELIHVNKNFNDILRAIIDNLAMKINFVSFIHECLTPIIYLLKKHQTLDDFIGRLSAQYKQLRLPSEFPKLSTRMLIHVLLLNSNLPLSRIIISLLSKRNSVPFLQPTISNELPRSFSFVPDIIHIWDYYKPTILSFGIGQCSGKSTLLNTLFMCSFEQSVSSIYFQETIDIDFGYSLNPTRSINVADAHGIMTEELLSKIRYIFNAFIVQVEYMFLEKNFPAIMNMMEVISKAENIFLIVRDVPTSAELKFSEKLADRLLFHPTIEPLTLPNVADQTCGENQQRLQQLHENIFKTLPKIKCSKTPEELRRLLQQRMDTKYQLHTNQIYGTIHSLKSRLIQAARTNSTTAQYFSEYARFVELCRLQAKLIHYNFYETENDKTVYGIRRHIYELQQHVQENADLISDLFLKVLAKPNMLICLEFLGNELKQERTRLIPKGLPTDQLPIQKCLNLEVLWRNAIVCSFHQSYERKKLLYEKYYEYIMAGFPFEIIDGENFYYHQPFLYQTLKAFPGKKMLVISMIGPPNSGKSTLLNYMFGTFFNVCDGHCTRGIYGSFVKSNQSDFDYILLIDTEGLVSVEREHADPEYDRRIVLFCLAISHVVIVNLTGGFTRTIQTMLTLCADSLKSMDVTRIPKPIVHFILSQNIDSDVNNDQTAIDRILLDFQRLELNQSIDIQKETFHRLPSAFQIKHQTIRSNDHSYQLIQTDLDFLEYIQSIREKIFRSIQTTIFSNPLQWLKTSKTIFDTLQKFSDLSSYQDINDRQTDNCIRECIEKHLRKLFTLDYREQLITQSLHKTEEEIKAFFFKQSTKWQERAIEDLEDIFRALEPSESIRVRSQQFIRTQIIEMFNALQATTIAINEREQVKLLVRNGAGDLRNLIHTIIDNGTQMTIEQAEQEFDRMFNQCLTRINNKFRSEERLKQALNYIYANYNIYEKECLPAYQYLVPHLLNLNKINQSFILEMTYRAYQSSLVTAQFCDSIEIDRYSIDVIDNLDYLNKRLLKQEFMKYNNQLEQFQIFIRQIIQEQMPRILTTSRIDDENMFLRISIVNEKLIERILVELQDDRQINTEFIQKLIGMITLFINDLNKELAPFCLTLSRPLKSILHLLTVLLLIRYFHDEQSNYFKHALADLETNKHHLRNYFLHMVTSNTSIETNYPIGFLRELYECFHDELKFNGQRIINEQIEQYGYIDRQFMQELCDDRLIQQDEIQWMMNYIENPMKIIEQMFRERWNSIEELIDENLIDLKSSYRNVFIEFFFCIQGILDAVKSLGPTDRLINNIFQSEKTNVFNVEKNLMNKKQCMNILLNRYFTGQEIPMVYTIHGNVYTLEENAFDVFQLVANDCKPSERLIKLMEKLPLTLSRNSIGNLVGFFQSIFNKRESSLNEFDRIRCDFKRIDHRDTYRQLLDKVLGCSNVCPCCHRPCDVDHTRIKSQPGSHDNEHQCLTGHALRGMNGYKFEDTEEASLLTCEQIKDDEMIVVNTRRYLWLEFKLKHPQWKFDRDDPNQSHEKFRLIWQKIGPILCEKYNMKYVINNTASNLVRQALHYILILDGSVSINGRRWEDLMQAIQKFLIRRRELSTDDRITIIVFSDVGYNVYFNEKLDQINMNAIQPMDQGTNFSVAFRAVKECIDTSRTNTNNETSLDYAIVFVSDGEGVYPQRELDELVNTHRSVIKQFSTLAFGCSRSSTMKTLEKINQKMNGSLHSVTTLTDLLKAYAEIATNRI